MRNSYRGKSLCFWIEPQIWRQMQNVVQSQNLTHQQLVIAAAAVALSRPSNDSVDITLGLPFMNRGSEADLTTIGLFLEPLPVRIQYTPPDGPNEDNEGGSAVESFLQTVQDASRQALAYAIPWHQLLKHFQITPDYPNHPLFETVITFHELADNPTLIPGVEPCVVWADGAKFQLMCEFTAVSTDRLLLRIEHDTECFSDVEIAQLQNVLTVALDYLTTEKASFGSMLDQVREDAKKAPKMDAIATDIFGKEFR